MQFTVRIPDDYKAKVSRIGKKLGLKRSHIVRLALKQFIDENLSPDPRTPFQKVSHLLGKAESGLKDLGQRHRDYLVQKIRKGSS